MQRREDAERGEQAAGHVGDRAADAHRAFAGLAGDRHDAAHALRDLVEAWTVAVRAVLAEAGNAGEDDARIHLRERLVIDAEAELDVGPEVLHHHVGRLYEPEEDVLGLGQLEVERHRALVAVQVLHVRPVARTAHVLVRIRARRRFDLDHVGAEVGELAHTTRTGAHARQV